MAYVKNSIMLGSGGGGTTITVVANYSALPDPTTVSGQFYWAEASQGTAWLPGALGGTYYNAGMYYSNGTNWSFVNVPYQATQAEVNAGVNTDKFVTPNTLAGWWTNIKTLAQTISGIWTWSNGVIFSAISNPSYAKGLVFYDSNSESLAYYDDISGTTNNINYEQTLRARNNTGATIPNGSVVYINGALGQNPTIALARADSLATCEVIGMATHDIPNNTVGKVTTFGLVNDLDTSAFSDGALIYLSPTTAGLITATAPSSPNYNAFVGVIAHSHVTLGKIFIHPSSPISLNTTLGTSNLVGVSENVVKSYADSKVADSITDVVTTVSPSQNAVFDEFALRSKILVEQVTSSSAVTGTTAETIAITYTLSANSVTKLLQIVKQTVFKTGTAGISTIKTYLNTTNDLSGTPLLICRHGLSATQVYGGMERTFSVDGTTISGFTATTNNATDIVASAVAPLSSTFSGFGSTFYVVVTIQNASAADSSLIKDSLILGK